MLHSQALLICITYLFFLRPFIKAVNRLLGKIYFFIEVLNPLSEGMRMFYSVLMFSGKIDPVVCLPGVLYKCIFIEANTVTGESQCSLVKRQP